MIQDSFVKILAASGESPRLEAEVSACMRYLCFHACGGCANTEKVANLRHL